MTEKDTSLKKTILHIAALSRVPESISQSLDDAGYHFLSAESAPEAISLAQKHLPDVIFASISQCIEKNGQLIQQLKQISYLETAPLVAICQSEAELNEIPAQWQKEIDDCLVEPYHLEAFMAKLTPLFKLKAMKDQTTKAHEKLGKAVKRLKKLKSELEYKNRSLVGEKKKLQSSLKQISSMIEEREDTNKKLSHLLEKQKRDFNSLTALLSSAIESKRQYHRGHSQKVAEISVFIAKEFRLTAKAVRQIEIAALLHEIGENIHSG